MTAFIDAHVHPPVREFLEGPIAPFLPGLQRIVPRSLEPQSVVELAEWLRSRNGKAVLLGWHGGGGTHAKPFGGAMIAQLVEEASDVFRGFSTADPSEGAAGVASVHEAARLGLAGISLHPAAQGVSPSHRSSFPLWETAAEHDLVCLVHTGWTRLGSDQPGGSGIMLEPARPIHVDTVAAEFSTLRIVLAHTGSLWLDEALAVALHKRTVWLDISGQSPKSFSPQLLDAIRGPLRGRVLFGSDYPFASTPDEWIDEWHGLGLPDDLTREVLHDNAADLLDWHD